MIFEWRKTRKPASCAASGRSVIAVLAVLALVAISKDAQPRAQPAGREPCSKRQIRVPCQVRCAEALCAASTSVAARSEPQANQTLLVTVVDENSVAVPAAQVMLTEGAGRAVPRGETDHAGRYLFSGLHHGNYELRVAKEGFYEVIEK